VVLEIVQPVTTTMTMTRIAAHALSFLRVYCFDSKQQSKKFVVGTTMHRSVAKAAATDGEEIVS
jgi:hypothetical protein